MTRALAIALLAGAGEGPWQLVETRDGVELYERTLEGERVVELKLQFVSHLPVERLCDAAYGPAALTPDVPDITTRKVLSEGPFERLTYEQISAPVVSDRDYAVRAVKEALPGGGCRVRFEAANQAAPKVPDGFVRIEKLKGSWSFEPDPAGLVACRYVIFTDPGGSIPAVFVEGSRKKTAFRWVKMVLARAAAAQARDAGID